MGKDKKDRMADKNIKKDEKEYIRSWENLR